MRLSMYQEIELMGAEESPKPKPKCGTLYAYQSGCRCTECRAANLASTKKYAERRKVARAALAPERHPFTELMGTAMRDADEAAEKWLIERERASDGD